MRPERGLIRHRAPVPRTLALATVSALWATGCALNEPIPPPAAGIELPAQWSTPPLPASPEAPVTEWWRGFDDSRLDEVVHQAIAANHDLAAAAARVALAQAQARVVGGAEWPQVDAEAIAARERRNLVATPLLGEGSFIADSRGVSLNASWELDLWNRLGAQTRAAYADAAAAEADYAAARLSLAGQAAKGFYGLGEAERQAALARRTLEIREATTARVRRRYEAGLAEPLDLRLALASEAAAAALLERRQRELASSRRQLETLLGRYPDGTLHGPDALPVPPVFPAAGTPATLLARRPDLAAAELRIAAAGGRVEAARAALYPQLRLTGSAGRQANEFGKLSDPDFNVWSLAASLLAPLFHGGSLRAQVTLARASLAEALAAYRQRLLGALLEVERALAADRLLAREVAAALRHLEQAEAAARLAEERYAAGLTDLLTVFEAERQRLDAASQALTARRERLQARIDLYLALGGGFDAR